MLTQKRRLPHRESTRGVTSSEEAITVIDTHEGENAMAVLLGTMGEVATMTEDGAAADHESLGDNIVINSTPNIQQEATDERLLIVCAI